MGFAFATGTFECALGKLTIRRRQVEHQCMHDGCRRRTVGVFNDQHEAARSVRNTVPGQWRRDLVPVFRIADRDRPAVGERRTGHRNRFESSIDGFIEINGLVQTGAFALESLTDEVGEFFEHNESRNQSSVYGPANVGGCRKKAGNFPTKPKTAVQAIPYYREWLMEDASCSIRSLSAATTGA